MMACLASGVEEEMLWRVSVSRMTYDPFTIPGCTVLVHVLFVTYTTSQRFPAVMQEFLVSFAKTSVCEYCLLLECIYNESTEPSVDN